MNFFVLIFALLLLWGVKFNKLSEPINGDYFSVANCLHLRGALSIVVVFHHLSLSGVGGSIFFAFSHVGFLAVAVFFFISGYGLVKSYGSKTVCIDGFVRKRTVKLLIPYLIVVLLYWLLSLVLGEPYTPKEVLLSFATGHPIAKYSWYIIVSILLYAAFWLAAKLFKGNCKCVIASEFAIALAITFATSAADYLHCWYISNFALPFGMLYAVNEKKILSWFNGAKRYLIGFAALSLLLSLSFASLPITHSDVLYNVASILFSLFVAVLLMKVRIGNAVLGFLGKISLELYLIHGAMILLLRSELVYIGSDVLFALAVLLSSVLAALLLNRLFKLIR